MVLVRDVSNDTPHNLPKRRVSINDVKDINLSLTTSEFPPGNLKTELSIVLNSKETVLDWIHPDTVRHTGNKTSSCIVFSTFFGTRMITSTRLDSHYSG